MPTVDSSDTISSLLEWQEHVMTFLPIAPTVLSIMASSTILYLVIRSGFTSAYKRILFGLSVSDIVTSTTFALQPFLLPTETSQRLWASGNDATCTLLGAFTQLTLSTVMYNGVLSFYYLLIIRFGVKESVFARRYEPWMHGVAIAYPILTAIAGVGMNAFHEVDIGHGCWIAGYPEGCSEDEGECKGDILGWLFMGLWVILILLSIIAINFVIYWHVRVTTVRGRRRSFNTEQQTKRLNEVAVQCFLYIAAFVGTFIWVMVLKYMDSRNYDSNHEAKLFPVRVLNGLLLPSTGFFNLFIYLRPRYVKTRSDFPTESRFWAVRRALYGEAIAPSNSISNESPSQEKNDSPSNNSSLDLHPEKGGIRSPESCPDDTPTDSFTCSTTTLNASSDLEP